MNFSWALPTAHAQLTIHYACARYVAKFKQYKNNNKREWPLIMSAKKYVRIRCSSVIIRMIFAVHAKEKWFSALLQNDDTLISMIEVQVKKLKCRLWSYKYQVWWEACACEVTNNALVRSLTIMTRTQENFDLHAFKGNSFTRLLRWTSWEDYVFRAILRGLSVELIIHF